MENMGRPTFVYRREMKNRGKGTTTKNKKELISVTSYYCYG